MDSNQYFKHARALGAFAAVDCLSLAREAAELDRAAASNKIAPPATVAREVVLSDADAMHLSFGIKVF